MSTNFPTGKDTLVNPTSNDTLASVSHSGQHTNANDAIEALEDKVGITDSSDTASLDYKVSNTSSVDPGHKHTKANITDLPTIPTALSDLSGTLDDITDGSTYVKSTNDYTDTEKTKLSGIEAGAEVNNISDVNATDLTDGGSTTLHTHNYEPANANIQSHISSTSNPHTVTLAQATTGGATTTVDITVGDILSIGDGTTGTNKQILANNGDANLPALIYNESTNKWQFSNNGTTFTDIGSGGTGSSPLTTKGDIYTYSTSDDRLPVGTDGYVLSADSNESTGLKWIAAGGTGTVTSVDMTVPTGLAISGNPITTNGTLALTYDTGYQGYTTTESSKLSGIEAGAEVNTVDSVNTQTGVVVLDADDISDTSTTNKFVTATDLTNLSNLSGTNTGDQDLSSYAKLTDIAQDITANSFVTDGGTSSQFVKGDGSLDSSTYLTSLNGALLSTGATTGATSQSQTFTNGVTLSNLTASKVVFTDASKNLTSTGIGISSQFIKGDGSLDSNTYLTSLSGAVLTDQTTPQTIGDTTNRLTKLWATDITCTNAIAGSITGNAATVTNATLTTALTVNTGTVTLTGNVANTSVLTIGAGAVSVSGTNTGNETTSSINTLYGTSNAFTCGTIELGAASDTTISRSAAGVIAVEGTAIPKGTGTSNQIAYWSGTNTISSLTTATYPSLTELSYVKGVTSAIQTQINAKAPSTSPTFATSITGSYLTASEILITDASKHIVSAPVATYPSLTELTYVKGVTSAIQGQIDGKISKSVLTTKGDLLVGDGLTSFVSRLAAGTDGYFLTVNSGATYGVEWGNTLTSPVVNTSISGTAILDEDDMASNSATKLATQQSIKAYIDNNLLTNIYKFRVYRNSALTLTATTWTRINLDSENYDTNNNFDNATNYRYVAPINGYYHFDGRISFNGTHAVSVIALYKNGSEIARGNDNRLSTSRFGSVISTDLYLAANDYIELYYYCDQAIPIEVGSSQTYMDGCLISK